MAAALVRRGARRSPDDAQPAARRERDAPQPGPHDGDRSDRARLLPPGDAHRALDDPAAHDRAREPVRRPGAARVRRGGRRGLPAVLRPARRARFDVRAHVRDGLRTSRLQSLHGGRARSMDRRADRSARSPSADGRVVHAASSPRSIAPLCTRCAAAPRCASSCRARCAGSRASTHAFGPLDPGALPRARARGGASPYSSATSGSTRRR